MTTTVKELLENLEQVKKKLEEMDPNTPIKMVSVDSGGYTDDPDEVDSVDLYVQLVEGEKEDFVTFSLTYEKTD